MLKPKDIEKLPDRLIELYSELEQDILADMARRISTYDYYIPAAQWQRNKLVELGNFENWIIKALSKRTGRTKEEIKALMEEAGMKALKFDDSIYKADGLDVPPVSASPSMLDVLNAGIKKTNGLFENLTGTTANTATKQFENALDRAYMQITSGAFDKETSIKNAIKDLARQGVGSTIYPTGHIDSIDVAVRRAVVTGVNQTALKLQETRAEQMGCDLVETTAHEGARPSHAEWQGKIFSLSGKSNKYPDFKSTTGYGTGSGLGGWNCRHSFYPYFEGISERAYTNSELKAYNSKNIEYNGQKITEYEASQVQRNYERKIRRWKREKKGMEAAGLPSDEASAKVSHWQSKQRDFIDQTGLKRQYGREQIYSSSVVKLSKERIINNIQKRIQSGKQPLKVESGKQGKHIKGHKNYIDGRSYLTLSVDEAQKIINEYAGKGSILLDKDGKWKKQEIIQTDKIIGFDVDDITGAEIKTSMAKIHYSKKGVHIVPYANRR